MISPLMIVVILIAVLSMINQNNGSNPLFSLIPLYNSILAMSDVFAFTGNPVNIIITVASNVLYTGLGVVVLSRMFASEKIMFAK